MPCTAKAARSRCRSCTPGRYAFHPLAVAPSAIKSAISPFKPRALTRFGIRRTIASYARCAKLAKAAGYDGVEIMGSEGYLINQFIAPRTNLRTDEWGGSFENRTRFPLEIVRAVRARCGPDFIIIYRLSMLDLVEGGSTWDEVVALAKAVEAAGATIINTGIGWHEARIPTIATLVPRGAFAWVTRRLKDEVRVPLVATNRINDPALAEAILERGDADMVSMARPLLADADFVVKAANGRADEINTCIACNQACLDHVFERRLASCLVNPVCRARNRAQVRAGGATAHGCRRRRGPGGARRSRHRGGARPQGHAVRRGARNRRPVQPGEAHPRQGGVRGDDPLLRRAPRQARREARAGQARRVRGPRQLPPRDRRHRHRAARPRRAR